MKTFLLSTCCFATLAVAAPAFAQQSDATDSLTSVTSADNAFGRNRNVSVAERPHPEFAPEPVQAGSWEILPSIAIGAGYDDNLYAQRADEVGDEYTRIRPRVSISRPAPNMKLKLNGELDLLRYAHRISENATQYAFDGHIDYTIARDTSLALNASHGRYSQERVSPDSPDQLAKPLRFTITDGNATLSHVFNRLRVHGTIDVENRDYRDGLNPLGTVIDQDFRDRTTITGTGITEYALSPSISFFLAGAYNSRDYRERSGPVPARDSHGFEIAAGSSFEIGHLMRGSLQLGYLEQDYRESAIFKPVTGMLVRGQIAYFLSPLLTVSASVDRSVSETGVIGATGYLKTTSALQADYELLRNLVLNASATLEKRNFQNLDRNDDRWTFRTGGTYKLNKRIWLSGDFQHRSQTSGGASPGREFADNRVSIGVTLQGL